MKGMEEEGNVLLDANDDDDGDEDVDVDSRRLKPSPR